MKNAKKQPFPTPIELAFMRGNYAQVRKLAQTLLHDSGSTPATLEEVKKIYLRTKNDPYVLWIGIATLLFAIIVSWISLH